ncbi:MAG: FAD:protein FMN transferase [Propionibacteriaceae bacterium]|nr:FAD:protein FMN transferase [Propionibacteriaceae bacterium]
MDGTRPGRGGGKLNFDAIGTRWQIDTDRSLPSGLVSRIRARVEAFDAVYSRFGDDSLVSEMARRPGTYPFPVGDEQLFTLYRQLYDCTAGALTPLVGGALEHLGYDAHYRLQRNSGSVTVPRWDAVLSVEGTLVTTRQPLVLDVGAAGKGFLVDQVAELLAGAGIDAFVVDASGDLIHRGDDVERIGLESPFASDQVIGVANVSNVALGASAVTRRRWGDGLHHIIDPATGEPAIAVVASWVVHPSCAVADGLATALFLVEPEALATGFDFSYVRVLADGRVQLSTCFDGELFC